MPPDTQTRSLAELKAEMDREARQLDQHERAAKSLLDSTVTPEGTRQPITDLAAQQLRYHEGEATKSSQKLKGLQVEFVHQQLAENIAAREQSTLGQAALFSGAGGGAQAMVDQIAAGATKRLPRSLGDAFVEGGSYKSWSKGQGNQNAFVETSFQSVREVLEHALKAALTTSGLTSYERPPGVIMLGQERMTVANLLGQGQTTSPTVRYLREVSLTNAAGMVGEGGAKPEQTWNLQEVDTQVKKIALYTKVTDELFNDYAQVRSYINDRLPLLLQQREEAQLLSGDGTGNNLLGILNTPGILTQPKGTDTNVDAIYKGITAVRTQGFFEPDGIVISPTNWTPIRLLKTTTGEYVWGAPSVQGPETLFGKPVVVTTGAPVGTSLVGAYRIGGTVFYREGFRVEATNSNEADFINNLIAMRAEQREALAVWRPKAFCTVTGLES